MPTGTPRRPCVDPRTQLVYPQHKYHDGETCVRCGQPLSDSAKDGRVWRAGKKQQAAPRDPGA